MPFHVEFALENGVKPGEISETTTHLAFYSGWANASAAVAVFSAVPVAKAGSTAARSNPSRDMGRYAL
jgi:4-carboxymuconolactone decarboxylase